MGFPYNHWCRTGLTVGDPTDLIFVVPMCESSGLAKFAVIIRKVAHRRTPIQRQAPLDRQQLDPLLLQLHHHQADAAQPLIR